MYKNIVLIGMSGAGKTSVGRALSYRLKMAFVDMDDFIEKRKNMTVSEIFEKYGEEYFRKLETETAKFLSENYKNTIISTGGGVVLNSLNMDYLKESGTVIYINRSVEKNRAVFSYRFFVNFTRYRQKERKFCYEQTSDF